MIRSEVRIAWLCALAAYALTACGGDETEPDDPPVTAEPEPEAAEPEPAEPEPETPEPETAEPEPEAAEPEPEPPPERTSRPSACGDAATASIGPSGGALTVGVDGGALVDATVSIGPRAFAGQVGVTVQCASDDIVGAGYVPLGKPLHVATRTPHRFGYGNWARVRYVFDATAMPEAVRSRHLRLYWKADDSGRVAEPPMVNPEFDLVEGTVAFDTPGLGVFQVGYRADAGQPVSRRFAYRAIAGISMGAGGAAYFATKHHEKFDYIMPLGGAVDWVYLLDYITTRLTGGFCRHDQGGGLGAWCGVEHTGQQFEHRGVNYNNFYYQDSGGSFDREEYGKLFQDLAFAYGNPLMYNPDSPYLPPGVPNEELLRPVAQRCAAECRGERCPPPETFTIERGFYDDEYNPDGDLPVIMFCDGEDGEPLGKFDGNEPHDKPSDLVLAVDLNGNGRRDTYEPVIRNMYEPYGDVGCDSVPSSSEPGYDPIANPDPAGDDYDWYRNPLGTEGNWMYDGFEACGGDGAEPYIDAGIDGLLGTPQYRDGGYDWGEGNGRFDYNPNYQRALELNGGSMYLKLTPEQRARLQVWTDGGIRDLFNFATAANHWMGRLQAGGQNVGIYDDFPRIMPEDVVGAYLPGRYSDPFGELGQSVLMRYGDPWLDDETILETQDGQHVGTTIQALNRFMSMYDWVHNRWEHLEFGRANAAYGSRTETVFFHSERFGKTFRYAITVPPGYDDPAATDERYPLLILLHGYGQRPEDLPGTGVLLSGPMVSGAWARSLIVSPDGSCGRNDLRQCNDGIDNDKDGLVDAGDDAERRVRCARDAECTTGYRCRPQTFGKQGKGEARWCCREGMAHCGPPDPQCGLRADNKSEGGAVTYCSDGVDNDRDGLTDLEDEGCMGLLHLDTEADCREGSFYTAHQARKDGTPGGPDWEGALLDMIDHIDTHYRTRRPETVTVPR